MSTIKAGHYYAAAYNGNNGDLILGVVRSVRTTGHVVLDNLLSGTTSTKKTEVLQRRNKRISKKQADELLKLFNKTHDKQKVRAAAVGVAKVREKKETKPSLKEAIKMVEQLKKRAGHLLRDADELLKNLEKMDGK